MASRNSRSVRHTVDLSALSAEVAERVTGSLQEGLAKLFMYQHKGQFSVRRQMAQEILYGALVKHEEDLADRVQHLMGMGLYRLITQKGRPAGFKANRWRTFEQEYEGIASFKSPSMRKSRAWLTRRGFRSYREYQREGTQVGKQASRRKRRDQQMAAAKAALMRALERQARQSKDPAQRTALRKRARRIQHRSGHLMGKPYGVQSGAFARSFLGMPVELKVRLGHRNTPNRVALKALSKKVSAADSVRRAAGEGGLSLSETARMVVPGVEITWDRPMRTHVSMRALLLSPRRRFRMQQDRFPLWDQNYALAALESALEARV